MRKLNIAVAGATGLVGKMFLQVLDERDVPIDCLRAFSSARSAGQTLEFRGRQVAVEELAEDSFGRAPMDFCLFAAGSKASERFAPLAAENGIVAIDNSAAFRLAPGVPLVVPEVNGHLLSGHGGIIANPNCCVAPLVVALKPLSDALGLERVVVTTFQSVSGAGQEGIHELADGKTQHFPHSIRGNLIPHIDDFGKGGYTGEELKIIAETRKIMGIPKLPVTATAVRVPVMHCHSLSVNVELKSDFKLMDVFRLLEGAQGLKVVDDIDANMYPMPLFAAGLDLVQVGRIRRDKSRKNCVNLWIVADNLRKGAATNAVQIIELMMKEEERNEP